MSLPRQSLSESEHQALLAAYLAAGTGTSGHAIEFAVGPVLAANAAAAIRQSFSPVTLIMRS